jgi:hypothetical protein
MKPIAQYYCFVEGQSWFRTGEADELVDGMLISAHGVGRTEAPQDCGTQAKLQRVSIADSSGASPVSSALDHSARRDPGGAITTLTRSPAVDHHCPPKTPCSKTLSQGKTITSSANLYGFFVTFGEGLRCFVRT